MTEKIKENNLSSIELFLYLLIYKTTIELIYVYLISPLYGYSGLETSINTSSYIVSIVALIVIAIISPKNKKRPSTYIYVVLTIFVVIPVISFYWLNNQDTLYIGIIIIGLFFISMILKIKPLSINMKSNTAKLWLVFIFGIHIAITIILIVQRGGIDPRAFNFDSVYSLRSEHEIRGIWGYFLNWSTKVFFPFFFVYFYYHKKKIMIMSVVLLQLLMYLSFGNKAFLFSIGVLILMTVVMKRGNFIKEFILSMAALNILAYFTDKLLKIDTLRRAIPYRLVFIPAQIQYQYFDFFNGRRKLLFAEGVIGKILSIRSPFNENISNVIGMYYSQNGLGSNSNTGIFADAYANGGIFGVVLISILFGMILLFIDSSTNKLPLYVVMGAFGYLAFVLNDTGLLTTFLTGGMGIMLIILMIFNSSIIKEDLIQ